MSSSMFKDAKLLPPELIYVLLSKDELEILCGGVEDLREYAADTTALNVLRKKLEACLKELP